ncbi:MAG: hypothetical protein LRY43_04215, partial [Gammaproteobacteria bacterium]|nr:hypothetical protein [Gammaproteobacteria bacterium]
AISTAMSISSFLKSITITNGFWLWLCYTRKNFAYHPAFFMMSLGLVTPYSQSSETFLHKLSGCGYALQISEIFNQEKKSLLVICNTIQEAQQLLDELPFFLTEKNKQWI